MARRAVSLALALLVATGVLYLGAAGVGTTLPPLGNAFNPGRGVWTAAADAELPHHETLHLSGLHGPVTVAFDSTGVAHIVARDDTDAFQALGYVHARFRLFQMDLERRQGEGRLAEVFGPAALDSDRFELQLGLVRTAALEWQQADPVTRQVLTAYARGVNERIAEDRAAGSWPMLFPLSGYTPADWRPEDTLVVKGDMTQTLDFQTTPLNYALLVRAFGYTRTMSWFPVLPPNEQHPYDAGPYRHDAPTAPPQTQAVSAASATAAASLLDRYSRLPVGAMPNVAASNNWAVDGTKSKSGKPMLAGDPHLHLTLPSIWYQVSLDSPGYHFAGVSIPGTPGIIIGRNRAIAWSLTDTQSAVTYYYEEKTDSSHPDQYFWKGAWRRFTHVRYDVPVKGGATQTLDVKLTVHGPVMTQEGLTYSVWWAGAIPSQDIAVLRGVSQATNFTEFKQALRGWYAPTHNFVYADTNGHIGLIAPGFYPLVAKGDPWLPLRGTGESDVIGAIPYDDVPQVYDPPEHFVFSANQRPVGPAYPYYMGTAMNDFDPGYRANEIQRFLSTHDQKMTVDDMAALQNDNRDFLASRIVPKLVSALASETLHARETEAFRLLEFWDYDVGRNSAAATIWWFFLNAYLQDTFGPWWSEQHPKVSIANVRDGLTQTLEQLTLARPDDATFAGPRAVSGRSASAVMTQAFRDAVEQLSRRFGGDAFSWTWGRYHQRELQSLALIDSLSYGPRPADGDAYTPDAAGGDAFGGRLISDHGPSWRMIVDWGGESLGVYPGGQSENGASPWYRNRADAWWTGNFDSSVGNSADHGAVTWTLTS